MVVVAKVGNRLCKARISRPRYYFFLFLLLALFLPAPSSLSPIIHAPTNQNPSTGRVPSWYLIVSVPSVMPALLPSSLTSSNAVVLATPILLPPPP